MIVFVYEYACAVNCQAPLPESIRVEGRAMLAAVVEDFQRVAGVEVLTLADEPPAGEERAFKEAAAAADWSLIIAPEFDGLLLDRCLWVQESGGRLLGPSGEVVRLAGDKWATYQLLRAAGVPTPETCLATDLSRAMWPGRFVHKPRFGVGSQDTRLRNDLAGVAADANMLVQAFVPGKAASVAFLGGPSGFLPLLSGTQELSSDGDFHYLGGRIPLPVDLAARAERLGLSALQMLPAVSGYVGVDLVLGEERDYVIEINPRLTTSYVGLRVLAQDNLAEAMLRMAMGERVEIRWKRASVRFKASGAIQEGILDGKPAVRP